jgi:hypothetical protein
VSFLVFDSKDGANGVVAGNYFSFPSFEDFEEWKEDEERKGEGSSMMNGMG